MPEITVENLERLLTAFEKIPEAVKRNMVLAARQGADDVCDWARTHHKFVSRSGKAESEIKTDEHTGGDGSGFYTRVYLDGERAPHLIFQHEGTGLYGPKGEKYDIFPVNGKMLRFVTSPGTAPWRPAPYGRFHKDGFTYAYGVTHPGVEGDPFLYRAADDRRSFVNAIFDRQIEQSIREAGF